MNKTHIVCLCVFAYFPLSGKVLQDNPSENKVDSLFISHIISLKSGLQDSIVSVKIVSAQDLLFLDMFYYLSGIEIGKEEHNYARQPKCINYSDIKILETWYCENRGKIVYNNIVRLYCLINEMKNVDVLDIDDLEAQFDIIYKEIDSLKIK